MFRKRVDRYPTNTHWKYELGERLKRSGNYPEAIKMLQDARNDPKHRGQVLLSLGMCFQQIRQFKLAKQHYVQAVEAIPERERGNPENGALPGGKTIVGARRSGQKWLEPRGIGRRGKIFYAACSPGFWLPRRLAVAGQNRPITR